MRPRPGRAARRALAALAVLGVLGTPAAVAQTLAISPPSGTYTTAQAFDLALIVAGSGAEVVGGSAVLDSVDVTAALAACVVPGTLAAGGLTFRCPGVGGDVLGPGTHTLTVTLELAGGAQVTASVTWEVLASSF